jgi:GNAT superfamily N-acetyltransferase
MALFCDPALAGRIESSEVARIVAVAQQRGFAIPIAGGYATFAEVGSPLNKVAGLGFGGVPVAAEWDAVEHAFAKQGVPVQVELAHLGEPEIAEQLTARGYRLTGFENVLGRTVDPRPACVSPPGIEIRPSGDGELDLWLDVVVAGFMQPDTVGVHSHEEFARDVIARTVRDFYGVVGVRRYLALCDGVPAGGATVAFADGVAALAGASTLPEYRRRGIQSALLVQRLADAADAGCDIATVTTSPATKSQQNAQRQGFELLYTRAVLVKHLEGSR